MRDGDLDRERAAVRWPGRFALDARGVTIDELHSPQMRFMRSLTQLSEAMERLHGSVSASEAEAVAAIVRTTRRPSVANWARAQALGGACS